MYAKTVLVENETGLHARPAAVFTALAKRYNSKVYIRNMEDESGSKANAKSIVMLMAQGLGQGTTAEISAEGEDEVEAVEALVALVQTKFGES